MERALHVMIERLHEPGRNDMQYCEGLIDAIEATRENVVEIEKFLDSFELGHEFKSSHAAYIIELLEHTQHHITRAWVQSHWEK